jgi:hypothetical protein
MPCLNLLLSHLHSMFYGIFLLCFRIFHKLSVEEASHQLRLFFLLAHKGLDHQEDRLLYEILLI